MKQREFKKTPDDITRRYQKALAKTRARATANLSKEASSCPGTPRINQNGRCLRPQPVGGIPDSLKLHPETAQVAQSLRESFAISKPSTSLSHLHLYLPQWKISKAKPEVPQVLRFPPRLTTPSGIALDSLKAFSSSSIEPTTPRCLTTESSEYVKYMPLSPSASTMSYCTGLNLHSQERRSKLLVQYRPLG